MCFRGEALIRQQARLGSKHHRELLKIDNKLPSKHLIDVPNFNKFSKLVRGKTHNIEQQTFRKPPFRVETKKELILSPPETPGIEK